MALLNVPYYWVGVLRTGKGDIIRFYDLVKNIKIDEPISTEKVYFRAEGDFDNDLAKLSYSTDGTNFKAMGTNLRLGYQMKTFQGVRFALFAYNTEGKDGGYAEFDNFKIEEPLADRSTNLPIGKVITLKNLANNTFTWTNSRRILRSADVNSNEYDPKGSQFRIHDRGKGRVALEAMDGGGFLTVTGEGLSGDVRLTDKESDASLFMWQDMLRNQCMLLSLKTNRYIGIDILTGEPYSADWPGSNTTRTNGVVFEWSVVQ